MGQANELQLLVNQEARATSGCFWATNPGALSVESGLQAATAQLENRLRGTATRGGGRGQCGSREGTTRTHHIHRRVTAGQRCGRIPGVWKRGQTWVGIKTHMG